MFQHVNVLPETKTEPLSQAAQAGLARLIQAKNVKTVIDIDPGVGASTFFMAPNVDTVFAVGECISDKLHHFLSNGFHAGLSAKVFPIPIPHAKAAKMFDVTADLIHINYLNGLPHVLDSWVDHLVPKGVMCGSRLDPDATTFLVKFAQKQKKKLIVDQDFWYLE